jgi:hypothetical protein
VANSCKCSYKMSGCIIAGETARIAEDLLASERLCSMHLVG